MEIGFIGLGNIGLPMARRLVDAGHRVIAFDLDDARVAQLVDAGAVAGGSPADVGARVDTVLTSLPSPAALDVVALGPDGVAAGGRARLLVDLSTVGPATSERVGAALAERGVALVDAPVSGGVSGAAAGRLAVMVAGAPADRAVAEPLLAHLGRVFAVGDRPGMGQVMKLANNYLSATALAATSEAMVYGVKAGLDPAVMVEVVNAGSGRNSATEDKFPRSVLTGRFDFGFATGLMCKDLNLFAQDAERLEVPLWIGGAVRQLWQLTGAGPGADEDFTTVVRTIEDWAGVEVRAAASAERA